MNNRRIKVSVSNMCRASRHKLQLWLGLSTKPSHLYEATGKWNLAIAVAAHRRHLHGTALLLVDMNLLRPPLWSEPLVAFLVGPLELQICRRPRPAENGYPILEGVALREWTMSVLLRKLVRVEVFTSGLASTSEHGVVRPEGRGIRRRDGAVDGQGKDHSPVIYRLTEADPSLCSV